MKRIICLVAALVMVLAMSGSFAESSHKTTFDARTWGEYKTIPEPYYKAEKTLTEIAESNDSALEFLAQAWYNLLQYEVEVEGTKLNDTMAAKIYKGMKKGISAEVLTAIDPEAVVANAFFANTDKKWTYVYWIEWNLEDQVLRVADQISDGHKNVNELLNDYILSNWASATIRDPSDYFGTGEKNYILFKFGGKGKKLFSVFDKAYSDANGGKKNPIK